jgi:hypothetical protein
MRIAATLTVLLTMTAAATAQRPVDAQPVQRFNVVYNDRFFPQATPKSALASLVRAADLAQFDYIASYLMDEKLADEKIAERAKEVETAVERDLRTQREQERADPFKPAPENRLSLDPVEFAKRVQAEATNRGYSQLVRELRERFAEDPSHIRDLQRFLRDGEVTMTETTAKMTLKADKSRAIFFKKAGNRWFLEDRIHDAPAPPTTTEKE